MGESCSMYEMRNAYETLAGDLAIDERTMLK
jgi:hypothetical protein